MEKKSVTFLLILLLLAKFSHAQKGSNVNINFDRLNNTHDIFLSPWGPYSKKYAGVSHLDDMQSGLRFDFSVLPSVYGSRMVIPNVLMQSDYYPWDVNNNLTQYTYRNEIEWKDRVYVDVTYHVIDSATTLVEIQGVNNTSLPQDINLDLIANIDYPENYSSHTILSSEDILWKNAVEYESLEFIKKRPGDNLVDNGWLKGEVRNSEYINGRAIAKAFGRDKGDKITYELNLTDKQMKGNLAIRYQMKENSRGKIYLGGMVEKTIDLLGTGEFEWGIISYTAPDKGHQILTIESSGDSEMILNGLLITLPDKAPESYVIPQRKHWSPKVTKDNVSQSAVLKYKDISTYYGIAWDYNKFKLRDIKNDELDVFFRKLINDHVHTLFIGNNKGNYTNFSIGPLMLESHDMKTVYALLCKGDSLNVKSRLSTLDSVKLHFLKNKKIEKEERILPEGEKYLTGRQLLKATLMTNIVYPTYTQNSFIRHFTPGKWWNSIYTWDLGFIALGLNEINQDLAAECINAYTTSVGSQSAFILHGTPIPTQVYAFFDLWNKTQSDQLLTYFYPRLKQYYLFLTGGLGSSTTKKFKSNILSTWDYFYNSGGWDDYPAQMAVHLQEVEETIAPVANTAHSIRVAKMMRMAAKYLEKDKDIEIYDRDIKIFSEALQNYSWNSNSNYFSYTIHNELGYPIGHFKDSNDIDYNMGLDGAYPLMSGICNLIQQKKLIKKIFSPQHMWTAAGISVVDQSAPYYRTDGYWNGNVWMPHQWFFWKTMLDLGRPDLASKIVRKALEIYKTEAEASYGTFENFSAQTGRGRGWHHFSGLSSPILNWFASYYKVGTVTPGFEIWINKQDFSEDYSSYEAEISFDDVTPAHPRSMIVCMNPEYEYLVTFNGKEILVSHPYKGLLELTLPSTNDGGTLIINKLKSKQ